MTLSEKSAYLKGLMDGLNLNQETAEGKMIAGIVDLLQEMTTSISDLEENAIAVSDELDEIEDDEETLFPVLEQTLRQAAAHFVEAREKEGEHLFHDLNEKLDGIEQMVCDVEKRSPEMMGSCRCT